MKLLFIFLHFLQALLFFSAPATSRSVSIGLHASWPHTPISSEATAWVAQVMGNRRVLPFLQSLTALAKPHLSNEASISHRLEHQLLLDALEKHASHELVRATFAWVLHARQYSPHVQFHHSVANEVLRAFDSSIRHHHVFAVRIDYALNTAALLTDSEHIDGCKGCPNMEWNNTEKGLLPVALQLPREIDLTAGCPRVERQDQVMLFADILSAKFPDWLDKVSDKISAGDCSTQYFLRFWSPAMGDSEGEARGPGLQGFIIKAALRSTEFKVVDDRVFSTMLFQDCAFGDQNCQQTAVEDGDGDIEWAEVDTAKDKDVKDEERAYKGFKALQFIKRNSGDSLEKALELARSFAEDTPAVVRSKRFTEFDEAESNDIKGTIRSIRKFREVVAGDHLFINGYPVDLTSSIPGMEEIFQCLSFSTITELNRQVVLGEEGAEQVAVTPEDGDGPKNRLRVDLNLGGRLNSSLVWFNDLHNDSRYKDWPSLYAHNQEDIARFQNLINSQERKGAAPGTEHLKLARVKAHHLSLVVALDAGDPQQFVYAGIPTTIVRSNLPIRIGLVMVPNGRVSSLIAAGFHYFLRLKGRKTSALFLQMIQQVTQYIGGGFQQVPLTEQIVEVAFQQMAGKLGGEYKSAADVLDRDENIKQTLHEATAFAREAELFSERTDGMGEHDDVTSTQQFSLLGILNGVVLKDISSDVITVALAEQSRIATFLSSESRSASDEGGDDFEQWVKQDSRLIVVGGLSQEMKRGDTRLSRFKTDDDEGRVPGSVIYALREKLRHIDYLRKDSDKELFGGSKITVWVIGANRQDERFQRIASLVRELASSNFAIQTRARFAFLEATSAIHSAVMEHSPGGNTDEEVFIAINGKIVVASGIKTVDDLKVEVATEMERISSSSTLSDDAFLIDTTLGADVRSACASDKTVRSSREPQLSIAELRKAIAVSNVSSLTFKKDVQTGKQSHLSISAVVNPFGENAFVSCAMLSALFDAYSSDQFAMEVLFIPEATQINERIKAPSEFSKFLVSPHASFSEGSNTRIPPLATFSRLPHQKVITVSVEPPRTWFVASHATNYDMDNIVLTSLPDNVHTFHAEYQLKDLIVEGSCIDEKEDPPRGLKLVLENDAGVSIDTLVMANLGYFQLRVPRPGRWLLRLAYGPSSTVFSLKAMEMYSGLIKTVYKADDFGRVPILVESLSGARGILLRVQRKQGMEDKSVLDPSSALHTPSPASMGGRIQAILKSLYKRKEWRSKLESSDLESNTERINVFTVATGHLYERFMKIMMISATKHASRPVKFWLLENYLSPSFKKMLPSLAKRLGCEIGLVTYKWPIWLRAQTEKQRIIWAYKILFLDVLFPLDVGRIIFVDSDQVIRGDLAELMDIDLEGAPYGYVPFCDSRKELEPFRFWETGFWQETLRGDKYRISALYVVDLNRFRETAAGDTLRMIYQSLSADPNSLANLDQDLPNYASVSSLGTSQVVPIFDLPADWLWCETWCDDESKKTAKAIDLCNNPLTKEPKLISAKRIISEWVEYDDFASEMTEEIYKEIAHSQPTRQQEGTNNSGSTPCHLKDKCEAPLTDDESVKIEL